MIRRVGIWFGLMVGLCLASSATAETIPFDYWYGKIIGRTQIRSIHDAYNDERGVLTTNVKVGYRGYVSVGLGDLFSIGPTSQTNTFELAFHRPALSANVAIGARTRWLIDQLDLQEDTQLRINGTEARLNTRSAFRSGQSMRMLHKDIEFDSTRSLYYYSSGLLLQPRNWRLDVRMQVRIDDISEERTWLKYFSQEEGYRQINRSMYQDNRFWSVNSALGYGISRRVQISVGWLLSRRIQPSGDSEEFYRPVEQDSVFEHYSKCSKSRNRNYELYVEPLILLNSHHWVSIRPSFKSQPTSNQNDYEFPADAAFPQDAGRYESTDRTYGVGVNHTWISSNRAVSRSQILDDFSGYYGHRLAAGTLRVSTAASLSLRRAASEQWLEHSDGLKYNRRHYESRNDQLFVTTEATYFSKYNLDISLKFTLDRQSSGGGTFIADANYYHTQVHYFDIRATYNSYRWNPDRRREIGWDQISDIDYLFGPLLRPGDLRSSISITPPADRWTYRDSKESAFKFFKGESDNRWRIANSNYLGLCDGIEASLGIVYFQENTQYNDYPEFSRQYRSDVWTLTPRICWQPGQRFRVDFTVSETYEDSDEFTRYNGNESRWHEYLHTWQLYTVYTILI